jgi:hypothetical protein
MLFSNCVVSGRGLRSAQINRGSPSLLGRSLDWHKFGGRCKDIKGALLSGVDGLVSGGCAVCLQRMLSVSYLLRFHTTVVVCVPLGCSESD